MALEIHEPEVEMGGRQVIRVGNNKDRPMSWITFHFESETDAMAAHEQLSRALSKAGKVEWPRVAYSCRERLPVHIAE
jgi:hypothetical protein